MQCSPFVRGALLFILTHLSTSTSFNRGINFRVLSRNYLNNGMDGGFRFGIGYGVSMNKLNISNVKILKKINGSYIQVSDPEFGGGVVVLEKFEKAFCPDGETDECYAAIKGYVGFHPAHCSADGRYKLKYGRKKSIAFDVIVRQCTVEMEGLGRYDWFSDSYWGKNHTVNGVPWSGYYQPNSTGTFLSVRSSNILNKGIPGGFRVRVGGDGLNSNMLRIHRKGEDVTPTGVTVSTEVFSHTCYNTDKASLIHHHQNLPTSGKQRLRPLAAIDLDGEGERKHRDLQHHDLDSEESSSSFKRNFETVDDSDKEECKPALYAFISFENSDCTMAGTYILEYLNTSTPFEVYVKPCGDPNEYAGDYLYEDSDDDN